MKKVILSLRLSDIFQVYIVSAGSNEWFLALTHKVSLWKSFTKIQFSNELFFSSFELSQSFFDDIFEEKIKFPLNSALNFSFLKKISFFKKLKKFFYKLFHFFQSQNLVWIKAKLNSFPHNKIWKRKNFERLNKDTFICPSEFFLGERWIKKLFSEVTWSGKENFLSGHKESTF